MRSIPRRRGKNRGLAGQKRAGQYHRVSEKYLDTYLDEFCYRFNGRDTNGGVMFDRTVGRMLGV
jgi:hypothetical protein